MSGETLLAGRPVCESMKAPTILAPSECAKTSKQKFIRDIFFSNLPVPFQKVRTYIWLVILTRALGPAGFGAWSIFMVTLSTAMTFSTVNCGSALMRFLHNGRPCEEVSCAFSTVLAIVAFASSFFLAAVLVFPRQLGLLLFGSRSAPGLVFAAVVALVFDSLFEELKNLLRARRQNQSWAALCLARLLPETLVVILVACVFRSVTAAAWGYAIVAALSAMAAFIYLRHRHGIRLSAPKLSIAAKYLSFGLPLLPGVLASTISLGADRFVVAGMLGMKAVGIYSMCFTISALAFFLIGPINDVLFPELSSLHDAGNLLRFRERFRAAQKFVLPFAVGAAALMAGFPTDIVRLVSSGVFISGGATLMILGIQGIFMAFVLLYTIILNVQRRVWLSTAFWAASAAGIVLLDFVLVPRMGIAGAAVSQLVATGAGAGILMVGYRGLFRETFDPNWSWQMAAAFAAVMAIARIFPAASSGPAFMLHIILGAIVFAAVLLAERYFEIADLRLMKRAVF